MMDYFWAVSIGLFAFLIGRSAIIWGTLAYIVGWVVIIPVVMFGPKPLVIAARIQAFEKFTKTIVETSKPKGYKDFNTVEDLMNQVK